MGAKGAQSQILSILHPNAILKPNPDPNAHPNPQPSPNLPLPPPVALTKIEYWDRAGGGRNIVLETTTTNEVRTGKWMRAAQKGLKMSCIHPFGHHNWTRIKPFFSGAHTLPQGGGACLPFWKFWVPSTETPSPSPGWG